MKIDNVTCASRRRVARRSAVSTILIAAIFTVIAVSSASASFGITSFEAKTTNQDGTLDTQAGSHPYAAVTSFTLDTVEDGTRLFPDQNVKHITVDLPAGFSGNPTAVPTCRSIALAESKCPADSQVGVITLSTDQFGSIYLETTGVYSMVRATGQTADFGFQVLGVPVYIAASVRSGSDYGIRTEIDEVPEGVAITGSTLTLWGVPGDPSHDVQRGSAFGCGGDPSIPGDCRGGGASSGVPLKAFLTNPTWCGAPLDTTLTAYSWQAPTDVRTSVSTTPTGMTGCGSLSFAPSLRVQPDTTRAGAAAGLSVDLSVPQNTNPTGLATPSLREAVVRLPAGVSISPSAADGLGACLDSEIGIGTEAPVNCPANSKIGDVTIETPLLDEPLAGSVFLGSQQSSDPSSGKEFRVFLDAENADYGISIRLEGNLALDPTTGQLTASFRANPQLPFSDLKLVLKSGPRAPLALPTACGSYSTSSVLTPWASEDAVPATPGDSFQVSLDGNGAACPAQTSFAPAFSAGTVDPQAGGFSPFTLTFSRGDQEQLLGGISVRTPAGLLGVLKSVTQCPEPQASSGTCGPQSLIGHTTVGAGPGSNPFSLSGQVYLTGPYKGAPFGLSIVVPALAGPFDLGTVVVRASIGVDPHSAALTITSDPLPRILAGVLLDLRTVTVTIDRTSFMFNPTNCTALAVAATITSPEGAQAAVSQHFQAANCATLAFKPKFSASVAGRTSRANGAALDVKIASGAGQANIGKVAVSLPKVLPSRLSTIQKACLAATFAADPGACPAGSLVGSGTALTPILAHPLGGPAYLVSHGGAAFPDLVVVLRGEGITVDLTGAIDITKAGVTSSTFNSVPDVPISSFELKLPTGPHSALTGNLPAKAKSSLCGQSLAMPTSLTGQNGAQVKQSTKITVTGCPKARKKAKESSSSKAVTKQSKKK